MKVFKPQRALNRWDSFCTYHSSFCGEANSDGRCTPLSSEATSLHAIYVEWWGDVQLGYLQSTLYIDICAHCTMPALLHVNDRCLM